MTSSVSKDILKTQREKIDRLDDQIIDLLAERLDIVREVAQLKIQNTIPAVLPERIEEVLGRCAQRAGEKNLDPEFVRAFYSALIDHCCELEEVLIQEQTKKAS